MDTLDILHRSFLGESSLMLDKFHMCLFVFETYKLSFSKRQNHTVHWSQCKETTETAVASSKGANGASKGRGLKFGGANFYHISWISAPHTVAVPTKV